MRKTLWFTAFYFFNSFLSSLSAYGQPIDSLINFFGINYPQEKIHVHFDKEIYSPGTTIWFKAYLFADNLPSDISKNFYAELIDQAGKVVQRKILPIFGSSAAGNFDIPADVSDKKFVFRAFTTWMLNFDTNFLFTKVIQLTNDNTLAEKRGGTISLRFFPEGGDLVSGVENLVAFKAAFDNGQPAEIKGTVKNDKGEIITHFTTTHDGMGKFILQPEFSIKYYAEWIDNNGSAQKTFLPKQKNDGTSLHVVQLKDAVYYIIKKGTGENSSDSIHIIAQIYQQVVYKTTVDMSQQPMASGGIPVKQLPNGILQLTLFDKNWLPVVERIVFINNSVNTFQVKVNTIEKNLAARAKNIIQIEVPDTLLSNLSVSITDAGIVNTLIPAPTSIISSLLLTGDIRGYVNNPAYYFSNNSDEVKENTDLLMLTHGWRRFKWDDIAAKRFPVIIFQPENYIALKGQIKGIKQKKFNNEQLNIILLKKDSSSNIYSLPFDDKGQFYKDGLVFYDTATVYYQLNQDKNSGEKLSIVLGKPFTGFDFVYRVPSWNIYSERSKNIINRESFFAAQLRQVQMLATEKYKSLTEVIVRSWRNDPLLKLDEKYASRFRGGAVGYSIDVMNDPRAKSSLDIFQYIRGQVPGLRTAYDKSDFVQKIYLDKPEAAAVYINESESDYNVLSNLNVNDIAYIKVFDTRSPGYYIIKPMGDDNGGIISIYLKRGQDLFRTLPGLSKEQINGYAAVKEFYSPDYSQSLPEHEFKDVRSTLYWQPYLFTDSTNKKVTIQFYNNDTSNKLYLVIEGFNENGKLARIEKLIE